MVEPTSVTNRPTNCSHDGDCHTGGDIECNLSCSSRLEKQPEYKDSNAVCKGIWPRHERTYCGCVDGTCSLFVQPSG
jgi:hypothetical protein